jgi:translation initiation factor 1
MRNKNPTVYSTELGRMCPKCGNPIAECTCKKPARQRRDGLVRVQRESKGRKGKTVTLIRGIPLEDEALRSLLSELKRQCGAGGTVKDGVMEIQGDHRDMVFEELKNRGYTVKIVGG